MGKRLNAIFESGYALHELRQLRNLYEHFVDFLLHRTATVSCSFEVRKRAVRRTHIRRGGCYRRYWHIRSFSLTCHEKGWETTKLGCRHLEKTKPETLVNGKNTVHVRTRNGLSQNGYGRSPGLLGITASWSRLKIGSKAIAKRKPLAGQPCLTPLATGNCHRVAPASSTCVMLSL